MLKTLLGCGAAAACVIGSAPPAQAAITDCWFFDDNNQYDVSPKDCDVTRRTEPSSRTTSGYLNIWVISTGDSNNILEVVLWDDDSAEYTFVDSNGNVTSRATGSWWTDSDDDTRLDFDGFDFSMAFTKPSTQSGTGSTYPPAFGGYQPGGPAEFYQPTRGGGVSSGQFSDRPFRF